MKQPGNIIISGIYKAIMLTMPHSIPAIGIIEFMVVMGKSVFTG